jgi:hypothetical protein
MSSIRPEVLAFVRAAQRLLAHEDQAALSDDVTEKLVEYTAKLEQYLKNLEQNVEDADDLLKVIAQAGGLPHSWDGNGHPGSNGHP